MWEHHDLTAPGAEVGRRILKHNSKYKCVKRTDSSLDFSHVPANFLGWWAHCVSSPCLRFPLEACMQLCFKIFRNGPSGPRGDKPLPRNILDAGESFPVPKKEQPHSCLWICRLSTPVLTNVNHLLFTELRLCLCLSPRFRSLHLKEPLVHFGSILRGESLGSWTPSKAVHQSVMFSRKFYFAAVSTKEVKAALAGDQNPCYLVLYWLHKGLQHGLN